jgi:predicted TIM-barrel fold metal-dependent hydrolase
MVIDFHTHLGSHRIYPERFIEVLLDEDGCVPHRELLVAQARRWLRDDDGTRLLKEMDEAGIGTSVLLIIDAGLRFGEAPLTIEQSYALHRRLLQRYPGRFVVFAGVDPRRGRRGLELFEQSVVDWGFGGIKLYPPMGFAIDDGRLEDYFAVCATYGLPVLSHSGPSSKGLDNAYASHRHVAQLARRHPELTFVMAHAGHNVGDPEVRRALEVGNVMVDLSGFQAHARDGRWSDKAQELRWIFQPDFNDRVLFGSDYPLFHFSAGIADDLRRIRSVFDALGSTDRRALENVLWRNADRLLSRRRRRGEALAS